MAYVLSVMPRSPLGPPYQERQYERSWSSLGSNGTVQRHRNRQHSVGSLASAASLYASSFRSADHHTSIRSTSFTDLANTRPLSQRASSATSRLGTVSSALQVDNGSGQTTSSGIDLDPDQEAPVLRRKSLLALDLVDEEDGIDACEHVEHTETKPWYGMQEPPLSGAAPISPRPEFSSAPDNASTAPFRRWLSTLRRRKAKNNSLTAETFTRPSTSATSLSPTSNFAVRQHRKSESWTSSFDFVTTVKSATVTLASFNIGTPSRSGTRKSGGSRRWHESRGSDFRRSIDGGTPSLGFLLDEAAQQRSKKRREKLEELITTEESYLADLKALSNVRQTGTYSLVFSTNFCS